MPAAEVLIQTALLGEAIEAGPALVFVADEQMRYIAVNQFACEALGYTREELLALHVRDVARDPRAAAEYDELLARRLPPRHRATDAQGRLDRRVLLRAAKTTVAGLPSSSRSASWKHSP